MKKFVLQLVATTAFFGGFLSQAQASCPTLNWEGTWGNGRNGRLIFQSPAKLRGWEVTLTFDKNVQSMSAWEGNRARCDGTVCTFKHQPHNRKFLKGATLNLGFGINFQQTSSPPELVSATIKDRKTGQEFQLCDDALTTTTTTTTTTTMAPTTTTVAPSTSLGDDESATTSEDPEEGECFTMKDEWNGGFKADLNLKPEEDITQWEVKVTFDSDTFTTFDAPQGKDKQCSGPVCTFSSWDWNGVVTAGETKPIEIIVNYPSQQGTAPQIVSVELNGKDLCASGGGGDEGATTTQNPDGDDTTTDSPAATTTQTPPQTPCYDVIDEWGGGMKGRFNLLSANAVDSWDVEVEFDKAFTSLNVFNGDDVQCTGEVCTFSDKGWNGQIDAGQTRQVEFLVNFPAAESSPTVVSLVLNGQELCGGGSGGDVTTSQPGTTTQQPVTSTEQPQTTTEQPQTTTGQPDTSTQQPDTTEQPQTTPQPETTEQPQTTQPSTSTTPEPLDSCNEITNNYKEVLRLSLLFYEAQRSGKLPADQRVQWRKDSALTDGQDVNMDLSGGYYDAGDYVKFGFPMAWTVTTLAWGGISFKDGYVNAGQFEYLLAALKWGTDYFIKAHPEPNVFYGQVGDGNIDHAWVGRPEDMTMNRPSFKIDANNPGSDLAGETAAALASTAILFRDHGDTAYADQLIGHAKDLFAFADNHRGAYSDSITNAASFYRSFSGYKDELVWAALWLHKATGEQEYLDKAKTWYDQFGIGTGWFSWDDKAVGVQVLMVEAFPNEPKYQNAIASYCDNAVNNQARSPLGQLFYSQWGSLRYASNAVFACLQAAELMADKSDSYTTLAEGQMEYILGKTGRSFVVGYGNNPPQRPHHRSSTCPDAPAVCDWNVWQGSQPNAHVLQGALVGGPKAANDQYTDDRNDYIMNEVATDYNAGFQGVLAGLHMKKCM